MYVKNENRGLGERVGDGPPREKEKATMPFPVLFWSRSWSWLVVDFEA